MTELPGILAAAATSPRVAPLAHLAWREASVAAIVEETADAHSLVLDLPAWPGHVAGQHVDVRLTAPDGYRATRSYSLSSVPGATHGHRAGGAGWRGLDLPRARRRGR